MYVRRSHHTDLPQFGMTRLTPRSGPLNQSINQSNPPVAGISLDKLEFKTDGRILGEASLDVDQKLKLWVSAEDG